MLSSVFSPFRSLCLCTDYLCSGLFQEQPADVFQSYHFYFYFYTCAGRVCTKQSRNFWHHFTSRQKPRRKEKYVKRSKGHTLKQVVVWGLTFAVWLNSSATSLLLKPSVLDPVTELRSRVYRTQDPEVCRCSLSVSFQGRFSDLNVFHLSREPEPLLFSSGKTKASSTGDYLTLKSVM